MSIVDKLWLPDGAREKLIEGKVKLELFDARTGKKQEEVRADNYAGDQMLTWIKWYARSALRGQMSTGVTTQDWSPQGSFNGFWLTDASHAENQAVDYASRGTMAGFAYTTGTYAGADPFRGTINLTESLMTANSILFVCDWPTNAGNGNINSVYSGYLGASSNMNFFLNQNWTQNATNTGYGSTWTDSVTGLGASGASVQVWTDPDGVSYWELWWSGTTFWTMVKRTLGTGAIVSTVALTPTAGAPQGFANDGVGSVGNWWICTNNATASLYKFPAAGGAATASYTGKTFYGNCDVGGGYLWVVSSNQAAQYALATGNLVTTVTLSPQLDSTGGSASIDGTRIAYYSDPTNGDEIQALHRNFQSSTVYEMGRWTLSGSPRGSYSPYYNQPFTAPYTNLTYDQNGRRLWCNYAGAGAGSVLYWETATRDFFSRSLLPSLVTKTNTQTMKLTYQFNYS